MAPLQKRALFGLIFGIVWAVAMGLTFVLMGGADEFDTNQVFRLIIDGIWIGGLVVYLVLIDSVVRRKGSFDERDKIILDRSSRTQWLAVIFSMVAWVVGLTEAFRATGAVPIIFLYLMFIYTLVASSMAQSAGILIGYWRLNRGG
jgi:hypothetical protein